MNALFIGVLRLFGTFYVTLGVVPEQGSASGQFAKKKNNGLIFITKFSPRSTGASPVL